MNINITRIAKGIPMGGSLDYMDETTLENAFLKIERNMRSKNVYINWRNGWKWKQLLYKV